MPASWGVPTPTQHRPLIPAEPGPVEDVQCQPEATRLALNWVVPSGDVAICLVVAEQVAAGGSAHLVFQANTSGDALLLPSLVPATSYRLSLTVLGRNGLWSRVVTLVCATSAEGEPFPWPGEPPLLSQPPSSIARGGSHCPGSPCRGLSLFPGPPGNTPLMKWP